MEDKRRSEAIKSIQSLWTASIVVSIIWLLFVPNAIQQIKLYEAALDLTAWKLLNEIGKSLPTSSSDRYLQTGYVRNTPQTGFKGEEPPSYDYPLLGMRCVDVVNDRGESGRSCDPLVVQSSWPEQRTSSDIPEYRAADKGRGI